MCSAQTIMLLHIIVCFIIALILLWTFLVIMVSLHTTYATVTERELLGGADYIPCDQCSLPEHEYPSER